MINARIKEGYFWINLAVNAVIIIFCVTIYLTSFSRLKQKTGCKSSETPFVLTYEIIINEVSNLLATYIE